MRYDCGRPKSVAPLWVIFYWLLDQSEPRYDIAREPMKISKVKVSFK